MFFLITGLAMSGWAPMVPFAKDRLELDDASLGLLLLFLGVGAISGMPLTGWLITRIGSKKVMIISGIVMSLSLPALLMLNTFAAMAAALFVFGASIGAVDISMNAHGAMIQNVTGKHIMSSLHGLFSVGGLFGPLVIGGLLKAGLNPVLSASLLSAALLVLIVSHSGALLGPVEEQKLNDQLHEKNTGEKGSAAGRFAWLNGAVLFLGAMCFIAFLSEGAMLDWSALLLHDNKNVDKALSGLGYAFFSVAMAAMRLSGDRIISRFSSKTVVLAGSLIAFSGYACILWIDWLPGTLAGFALIGIGAANIVPVFFSAAGSLKNVPSAVAVSAIGTIGYAGQLAGPAALGFLAKALTLPVALFISGALFLIAGFAYRFSSVGTVSDPAAGEKQQEVAVLN